MNLLLDTHFLLWIASGSQRVEEFSWLEAYRPWGVSPVSLLEIQFLAEVGRIRVQNPEFSEAVGRDPRFTVDEAPLLSMVQQAIAMGWTRDPFNRLLAAHSAVRRVPLCTLDRTLRERHSLLPAELKR